MKNCKLMLHSFFQDESGQDLIEYALVAAIISLGAITTLPALAGQISSVFSSIGTAITNAV